LGPVNSICTTTSQSYKDQVTTWVIQPDNGTAGGTIWSGTNITSTTTPGSSLDKIYTNIGVKIINATTTGHYPPPNNDRTYTSTCRSTTVTQTPPIH
jgi:hypothetical protein